MTPNEILTNAGWTYIGKCCGKPDLKYMKGTYADVKQRNGTMKAVFVADKTTGLIKLRGKDFTKIVGTLSIVKSNDELINFV